MTNPSAVLYGTHDVRVEERPIPAPGTGQVQVAVRAVGVCGSDVHYYEHGRIADLVVRAPMVLGHEAAGEVTAVGDGVDPSRVGQTVAIEPGIPCRACEQCRHGRYNLCPEVRFFATPPIDGAFARYVVVDADYAFPTTGLTFAEAAMAEPVSVGVAACRKAGVAPATRVLVVGAGPVGLLSAQVARAFGADAVEVADVSPHRLAVAGRLGFHVAPALPEADVVLECSGSQAGLDAAVARTAPAGRVILIGMGADRVELDLGRVQGAELWVTGTFRYANCYPTAIELLESGRVDADAVITGSYPIARTEDALLAARRDPTALKVIVEPWAE